MHKLHPAPADAAIPLAAPTPGSRHAHDAAALPPALHAELQFVPGPGPRIALYLSMPQAHGDRYRLTPLLLVHSVNAAASAAEMRPVFERYGGLRPVVAMELPGFGSSERGALEYTPKAMANAILRTVAHLRDAGFRRPVDLMAVSVSCEFAALAALLQPQWFASVALVSPTGLDAIWPEPYQSGRTKEKPLLRRVLEAPWWSQALFRLITNEASVRYFLRRAWGSTAIDQQLLAYSLRTVRQPGARFAPLAFIAGALFTRGIAKLYPRLPQPVWIARGVRGDFTSYDGLAHGKVPDNWTVEVFGTGALPYFEAPALFASRYDAFLRRAAGAEPAKARPEAGAAQKHSRPDDDEVERRVAG